MFRVSGPTITKELVNQFAQVCGFAGAPHVKGERSVLSIKEGLESGACLHGVATLCLLNASLEKIFVFDEPYDVVSYGYDDVVFESPNIEGGSVEFIFTVINTEVSRFPLKKLRRSIPMNKITFGCEATNSHTRKRVAKLNWTLGYLATSELE